MLFVSSRKGSTGIMRNFRLLFLFVLYCVVTFSASAQLDTTKVYALAEVQFSPKRQLKEMVPFQTMDAGVIERLSCQSVADAVRYFSGVQIKDYGGVGGIKTINIRSMGTNQMGVFYDGIQLGNAQNGQIDLGRFSTENMESIDLYNGQRGSVLQSAKDYGSAGTIYLNTRKPVFNDSINYHLRATMKAGSFGLANPSILWEQKLSDKVTLSASAEYTYANGKYKFRYKKVKNDGTTAYDTTAIRENADINALRTELSLFGKLKEGEWKAQLYNYYSERGIPGYIARNLYFHKQRQWDDNFFVQTHYKQTFWKKYSILVNAKYAYDYTRYLNPDTTLQYIDDTYKQQEAYLSMANSVNIFPFWDVSLSADYQFNSLDATLRDFAYPTRHTGLVALATAFKFPNIKLQASVLGTFVHENVKRSIAASDIAVFTPTAIVSVRPWRTIPFDIRAFYKRIFRMPTFNDLYYTFVGNSMLEPEYVTQYDLGLSYHYHDGKHIFSDFGIQLDVYDNQVENKIVAIPSSNPFRWQMKNYGQVRINGIDVSMDFGLQWCCYWNLDLRLAYSYQESKDLSYVANSPYYGGQMPYTPWNSGSAVLNLAYKTIGLNYSFIYTGERYSSSANIPANYIQPWYTHDIALSYAFKIKSVKCTASAEVNNLFNQQYEVISGYPMPGTNFKIILKVAL